MKRDSFNVLFFIKKAKLLKNGEASVCMRITVNGARVENNIRKSIEPSLWNQAKECAKGKSRKSCDLNAYIEDARIKLYQTFNELEEQGRFITARLLQEKWLSGNFWLVSFKISYLCLPLFYETRTTPSCHPSGCAYRQL
mgnify:CR=1 FL=1